MALLTENDLEFFTGQTAGGVGSLEFATWSTGSTICGLHGRV